MDTYTYSYNNTYTIALHYAAFKNHQEVVGVLILQPSIDIDYKNVAKKTAAQLTTNKNIAAMLKEGKNAHTRKLLGTKFRRNFTHR